MPANQGENNGILRNKSGRFVKGTAPGNPTGKNAGRPPQEQLTEALLKAQQKYNKSFIEHFIERAYRNDVVAIALAKKILPDEIHSEVTGQNTLVQIIQKLAEKENGKTNTIGGRMAVSEMPLPKKA